MTINTNKLLAYMALISGLALSIVAEYYSILGLMAIFSAAPISVIVMGIALGVGKITATLWIKQNWKIAPWTVRAYLLTAITILILITSLGIFGFLSKAHSDQSLVTGDVQSRIAVYDEQIKTARENIDANRKALKQMDEAVDQVMARSSSETGANRAVTIRRSQQRERARLQSEIKAEQKAIVSLGQERAPIAAEVRKVEAKVGPIKYLAQFVYGKTDETLLEKAVTWVIIILIVVFDPLALILLLASQISFQNFRDLRALKEPVNFGQTEYIPDPKEEAFYKTSTTEGDSPRGTTEVIDSEPPTVTEQQETTEEKKPQEIDLIEMWNKVLAAAEGKVIEPVTLPAKPYVWETTVYPPTKPSNDLSDGYVQNEEQKESGRWKNITQASQISEKDYQEAVERNIDEMAESVRKGILPFYKVPYEIQDQVKQKLQNVNETNTNNTP